jgi:hypothetical protein
MVMQGVLILERCDMISQSCYSPLKHSLVTTARIFFGIRMDFERSDGVVINVSESDGDMRVMMIQPQDGNTMHRSRSIVKSIDTSTYLKALAPNTETSLREQALWVASRVELATDPAQSLVNATGLLREARPLIEPFLVESDSISRLIAHRIKSCEIVNSIAEVDGKRNASLKHITNLRNQLAVKLVRDLRVELETTESTRAAAEIEAESLYKESLREEKHRTELYTEQSRILESLRDANVEKKLDARTRDMRSLIDKFLSVTKDQQVNQLALLSRWKNARVEKRLTLRSEIHQTTSKQKELELLREFNIRKRLEKRILSQQQYAVELRNQNKKLERKRMNLSEKRQALAHDLFKSTPY